MTTRFGINEDDPNEVARVGPPESGLSRPELLSEAIVRLDVLIGQPQPMALGFELAMIAQLLRAAEKMDEVMG